jgi:hypothetical protein
MRRNTEENLNVGEKNLAKIHLLFFCFFYEVLVLIIKIFIKMG